MPPIASLFVTTLGAFLSLYCPAAASDSANKSGASLTQDQAQQWWEEAQKYYYGEGRSQDRGYALILLKQAAEKGYGPAQSMLGKVYYEGVGSIAHNRIEALKWYKAAAEQGWGEAQYELGRIYKDILNDSSQAIVWFTKAAKQGHSYALAALGHIDTAEVKFILGEIYRLGQSVAQNQWIALRYYEEAAKEGHEKALTLLEGHAQKGDAAMQLSLGNIIYPQNQKRGLHWYKKAAKQNYPEAQYRLGQAYEKSKNIEKAIKYYAQAALHSHDASQRLYELAGTGGPKGHPEAQFLLGWLGQQEGASNNSRISSTEWFKKAALQGHTEALFEFGIACAKGINIDKSPSQAIYWLSKAAEQGHIGAHYEIAQLYQKGGNGIFQDGAKMRQYLTHAAEKGHKEAQYELGLLYSESEDKKRAAEWFIKAAHQNHPKAQQQLGSLYGKGEGVLQNREKAFHWLKSSITLGNREAGAALKEIQSSNRVIRDGNEEGLETDNIDACYRRAKEGDIQAVKIIYTLAECYNAEACYMLARIHQHGWGIAKDLFEAEETFKQAALLGHRKARYRAVLHQLTHNPSNNLEAISDIIKLSGREAYLNYLRIIGKSQRKTHISHELKGLEESGHHKAQSTLADLYIKGRVIPLNTLRDIIHAYREAIRLYQLALNSGKPLPFTPIIEAHAALEEFEDLKATVDFDNYEYRQLARHWENISPLDIKSKCYLSFLCNKANHFSPQVKAEILGILKSLTELKERKNSIRVMHNFLDVLRPSDFNKDAYEEETNNNNNNRLERLDIFRKYVDMISKPLSLPLPSSLPGKLKVSRTFLQDPRVELFNSQFRLKNGSYMPNLYDRSVKKILNIFVSLKNKGYITASLLQDKDETSSGNEETLKTLLTLKGYPTNRFAQRLIYIADIIEKNANIDPEAVANQLMQWAIRGLSCTAASFEEVDRFYLESVATQGLEHDGLPEEERSLEMQVAVSLARLRFMLLDQLVPAEDAQKIHSVQYLEKRAWVALGLLGDAESFDDDDRVGNFSIPTQYLNLGTEDIIELVLRKYTPDVMAQHLAKDIGNGKISYSRIERRLSLQLLREKMITQGDSQCEFLNEEDYIFDRYTHEKFSHYLDTRPNLYLSLSAEGLTEWDALKNWAITRAREQMEAEFFDDEYKLAPKGTKALLYGLGYLEGE